MEALCLFIVLITIVGIIGSILYFPQIKIKNLKVNSYWVIALIAAIILVLTKCVSINKILDSFTANTAVNPIKILILFISMTILSVFLDEIGFFNYIAIKSAKIFNSNQYKLFFGFYFLISFLTVFTSNDIIILTFTPFICYFCKNTKINPIPYLIGEFFAANTLSMTLLIGYPTNIYIASNVGITFIEYFNKMFLIGLATAILLCLLLLLVFRKSLSEELSDVD